MWKAGEKVFVSEGEDIGLHGTVLEDSDEEKPHLTDVRLDNGESKTYEAKKLNLQIVSGYYLILDRSFMDGPYADKEEAIERLKIFVFEEKKLIVGNEALDPLKMVISHYDGDVMKVVKNKDGSILSGRWVKNAMPKV